MNFKSRKQQRILAIGYAREGFGFGRVLQSLLRRLCLKYEVHQFEMTCFAVTEWPWRVYAKQVPRDRFGEEQLPELVDKIQPDLIFLLSDIWNVPVYIKLFRKHASQTRIVAYCPLDGGLKPHPYIEILSELALLIVYTDFARREVLQAFAQLKRAGSNLDPPEIKTIPHGIDSSIFYPYHSDFQAERKIARAKLFPDRADLQDAFIVFNGNRNQSRKRIDLTLKGFSLFAAGKPENVKLYLHMGMMDEGINVLGYAKQCGITSRLLCTTRKRQHPVVSDQELNLIYNACDVGLNSSAGEGWGLVSFEHAATGAAQVVPCHSSCEELWLGSALMLDTSAVDTSSLPLTLREVSPDDIAEALQQLYSNPTLYGSMADAAYRNATKPEFQWDTVAEQFDRTFQAILSRNSSLVGLP